MSLCCGLDLGSRRTKVVVLDGASILETRFFDCWALAKQQIDHWVGRQRTKHGRELPLGSTGYGRHAAAKAFGAQAITEIRAFGLGAAMLAPGTRTLVDIGGQDAKVMLLSEEGQVQQFEMNDRCAAGTGKFFELVAGTLGISLAELSPLAESTREAAALSSVCAVFAESEIIGRMAEGDSPASLARGVFKAVAARLGAMLHRTGFAPPALVVGGGANPTLAALLTEDLQSPCSLHPQGEFFGAVGAARHAARQERRKQE